MIITDIDKLSVLSEDVSPEEALTIIDLLEKELENSAKQGSPGIGLAAPQIGINKKVAIVRVGDNKINLVNSKIVEKIIPFEFDGEGCLSFPGMIKKTKRYKEIVVENEIYPHKFIATDLLAVVIQHEIGHWNNELLPYIEDLNPKIKQKLRPNDLCNCGSGKKYKKCCGA
jgi:peptide deformylase